MKPLPSNLEPDVQIGYLAKHFESLPTSTNCIFEMLFVKKINILIEFTLPKRKHVTSKGAAGCKKN